MSFQRACGIAAVALGVALWAACGQVYRPVVIPCTGNSGLPGCPVEPLPVPANFHAVFAIYTNEPTGISTSVPNAAGGAMQIDVSGDSIIAETPSIDTQFGSNPTHAAILPTDNRVFVASAGSVSGSIDLVSSFTTVFPSLAVTGFGPVNEIALPNPSADITSISETGNTVTAMLSTTLNAPVGYTIVIAGVVIPCTQPCNQNAYNGAFTLLTNSVSNSSATITFTNSNTGLPTLTSGLTGATAAYPPQPVFLATTQTSAIYVANYNANSVSVINTNTNAVSNTVPVGVNPVSMAEIPNGLKLYVANQGDNTVSSLNTATLSPNVLTGFTGVAPVWVSARGDSQKIYVLTQGDGQLETIDVATDTVTGSASVGAGANYIFFDPNLNRLYVTNPTTDTVYVFSDTGGVSSTGAPNDTPSLLAKLTVPGLNASTTPVCPGCGAVVPVSVTALLDGSRFYVASYQIANPCPDPNVTVSPCIIPELTVFSATSLSPQYPSAPTMTLLTWSPAGAPAGPFATNQYAVPPVSACATVTPYTPVTTRFRVFTTAAVDSSHVYVSMCDAGAVADIVTASTNANNPSGTDQPADTLITDLPAAYSNGPIQPNGEPANQNPIFMLPGQ